MAKRNALGRGMKTLIPDVEPQDQDRVLILDLDQIVPNPHQPRKQFDQTALQELSDSIAENGIIQPIVVTRQPGMNHWTIVAGERRWRAAQLAGYTRIPVLEKDIQSEEVLTLALIENIQREDLNPIEEATALAQLLNERGFTQEELAKKLGKGRVAITNTLRLLRLPEALIEAVRQQAFSAGHARCLLGLPEDTQMQLFREATAKTWSVRQLEQKVKSLKTEGLTKKEKTTDPFLKHAEKELSRQIGYRVLIQGSESRGKLTIPYQSGEELQEIYDILMQEKEQS
jgi:ParB family chromosome partitioning protein